ncbi:GAF domain-containing protein [Terrimonas alba]|uniref:GAF domain-containing protein n=1 Tax=Terrimonas alba TaxID=3349636 RepID=UPI0035F471EC
MRTNVLYMAPLTGAEEGPEITLSFRPFIDYLKKRGTTNCKKDHFFQYVIEQFDKQPELYGAIDLDKVKDYGDLLILIYSIVSPIIEDELTHRWALCLPLKPVIFYYTNAYYELVANPATGELRKSIASKSPEEIRRNQLEFTYSLILEKCYGISTFLSREIIHSLRDEETGLEKYYCLDLDTRFVEIHTTQPLPELKIADFHSGTYDKDEMLAFLQTKLPLNMFRFEGFAINNVYDVTTEHSIENIKKALLNRSLYNSGEYSDVVHSLKTLVGNNNVEFGLLPVLKVNNKLVFSDSACMNSKLMSVAKEKGGAEDAYMGLVESYFKNPKLIFFRDIEAEHEERHSYLKMLRAKGIQSYALSPVFFNNSLAGVLEIYSKRKDLLNESLLSKLEPAMPLIAQLLKNSIDEFNGSIDQVVKERFTSLQSSVQWKFNEVAWHYLLNKKTQKDGRETEDIVFEKVFPLYGAVDIRNSTVQRNEALQKDLGVQFSILIDALDKLKEETGFGLIDEKLFSSARWLDLINNPEGFSQEVKLNDFLENDIIPFLSDFKLGNPAFASIIDNYFEAIDPLGGIAYENRRQLEKSMSTVIAAVNDYMEMMKDEIQKAYPSYFEKVRTDGVEYDIYIGQSIAPDKPFSDIYLKNLRLLQLTSMATIAKYAQALKSQLTRPIETTQLIFIHSQAIDIKFRRDEKRFDVEGAYNIRYHIVKKRIDKVNISGTNERLTQPGKIALVYFSQKEADEYIGYIKYLQQQDILTDDLEKLELEELQGVAGLKAIRVGVVL